MAMAILDKPLPTPQTTPQTEAAAAAAAAALETDEMDVEDRTKEEETEGGERGGGNKGGGKKGGGKKGGKKADERHAVFKVVFEDGSECMYGQDELLPSIITPPPPSPPIPPPPTSTSTSTSTSGSTDSGSTDGGSTARYTIDRLNRVVRCDLSGVAVVSPVDEAYISMIMDTPDTTLIIKGRAGAGSGVG